MMRISFSFHKWILVGMIMFSVLPACSPQNESTDAVPALPAGQRTGQTVFTPLTFDELANSTYTGITADAITLTDGRWEGEPYVEGGATRPTAGMVEDFMLAGDLDGDGSDEAVVLLWVSSGGSGTMYYVAAVGRRDGAVVNLGTALVGDRVQLRGGGVADGVIELEVIQQGPDDAACCPSQLARRHWTLEAAGLTEGESEITGILSLDTIAGKEWVLLQLTQDEQVPGQPEITLVLDGDRLVGSSGCNRYFAGVTAGDMPGELVVGPVGGTRMACPDDLMALENHYLEALGNVSGFSFLAGKLALAWQKDGDRHTLLFESRDTVSNDQRSVAE